MLDANSGNLGDFAQRGGKLIIYHGWADPQVPAQSSVDYRNSVIGNMRAGAVDPDSYLRLFMIPGMDHCFLPPPGPNLVVQEDNSAVRASTRSVTC